MNLFKLLRPKAFSLFLILIFLSVLSGGWFHSDSSQRGYAVIDKNFELCKDIKTLFIKRACLENVLHSKAIFCDKIGNNIPNCHSDAQKKFDEIYKTTEGQWPLQIIYFFIVAIIGSLLIEKRKDLRLYRILDWIDRKL